MKVYHDFFSYRGGIYRHTGLSLAHLHGYHSVRIVGWGEEFTPVGLQKYWVRIDNFLYSLCKMIKFQKVANSWGSDWGEEGFFRIVRGSNECDIESFVLGVWSEVDRRILTTSNRGNSDF